MKDHQHAVVLGLGASGAAAARLLLKREAKVRILDSAPRESLGRRPDQLESMGAEVIAGTKELGEEIFVFGTDRADMCVVSPGIPSNGSWVSAASAAGVPVCSELELGFLYADCPVIAVTGSNGKSTLVKLLVDTLTELGMNAEGCGNYDPPICDVVEKGGHDYLVVEVSSFQLETCSSFAPQSAVLLNVQPNHLDRHGSMDAYARLKARMFAHMSGSDVAVVNRDQLALVKETNSAVQPISIGEDADYHYCSGDIVGGGQRIDVSGTFLDNEVMGLTGAAAMAVVVENGWDPGALAVTARSFEPLAHRMQTLDVGGGIRFVDNSKSTTLSSVEASLKMTEGQVRLLAGGRLKETELGWIKKMLEKVVAKAYLYGEAGQQLAAEWCKAVDCEVFIGLEDAVRSAVREGHDGEVVLLSPGCTSFDQYGGYAERGEHFVKIVEELRRES